MPSSSASLSKFSSAWKESRSPAAFSAQPPPVPIRLKGLPMVVERGSSRHGSLSAQLTEVGATRIRPVDLRLHSGTSA